MDELIVFLRAQLDEDERTARAIPLDLGHQWSDPGPWVMAGSGGGGREAEVAKAADGLEMPLAEHVAHHIAAHDPARVLREIEAQRQMVSACERSVDYDSRGMMSMAEDFLRLLALPFADRPGYQDSWRP